MKIEFYKYQGTGNDFVMIDNRSLFFPKENIQFIQKLCDRKFGIGADGLILLENDKLSDFKMLYYNSDGSESSMCGNGGRCIVAFAKTLNLIENETTFNATDGLHFASVDNDNVVSLQMKNVDDVKITDNYIFLNTGSPHHIEMTDNLESLNVKDAGSKIRYSDLYGKTGSNVNFVRQVSNDEFSIRTYERGVEDETLACGTGATAVAIAMNATGKANFSKIKINVEGGILEVAFDEEDGVYKNVFLKGKAEFVFKGDYFLSSDDNY